VPEDSSRSSRRILDPTERVAEILFGLIMVLTITCSFSIGETGQGDVRNMLIGALGCNLAWGIIDAVMYWMACFSAHGQAMLALRALRTAATPDEAHHIIAGAMPPLLASVVSPAQFESMRQNLTQLPEPPERPQLTKQDWLGGVGVFLLVLFATLPVVLPFAFVSEARRALRISNAIAIVMLFLTGYVFGRYAGHRPWKMGVLMVIVGSAMVGITIALGGEHYAASHPAQCDHTFRWADPGPNAKRSPNRFRHSESPVVLFPGCHRIHYSGRSVLRFPHLQR